VLAWLIPILVFGIIGFGFFRSGWDTLQDMALAWWIANGSLSALGVIAALGHPLTVLTAFCAAPITSLNPTIAAGWVCGLVEAIIHKPRVSDLENISEQVTSFRGIWSNRVTKILLVIAFANIGSVIGTFLGVGKILSLL
jgi:pheromone shutdown protein TraB